MFFLRQRVHYPLVHLTQNVSIRYMRVSCLFKYCCISNILRLILLSLRVSSKKLTRIQKVVYCRQQFEILSFWHALDFQVHLDILTEIYSISRILFSANSYLSCEMRTQWLQFSNTHLCCTTIFFFFENQQILYSKISYRPHTVFFLLQTIMG